MNAKVKFIYSELVPLEWPPVLDIHNFKSETKDGDDQEPISGQVYERGKLRTITMPNPGSFVDLVNKGTKIEKDIFSLFLKGDRSTTQLPVSKEKTQKKFNKKYFEYKNQKSYSEFLEDIQKHLAKCKKKTYVSTFDLQNFFGQISVSPSMAEDKIGKFTERLTYGSMGLPVGPNISRILCQLTAFEVDKAFETFFNQKGLGSFKIFRYIDDYYVLHQKPLDDISLLEQLVMRLGLRFNYGKVRLNMEGIQTNKLVGDDEFKSLSANSLQAAMKKIVRYSRRPATHLSDMYCKDLFERTTRFFNLFLSEVMKNKIKALGLWKSSNSTIFLKAYIAIKNRNSVGDRKFKVYMDEFVINVWELILNEYQDNPAILNTFAGFIPIISHASENKQIIQRLRKFPLDNPNIFPVVCAMFTIMPEKSLDVLNAYYKISPKKGKHFALSEEDVVDRINSSYQYG